MPKSPQCANLYTISEANASRQTFFSVPLGDTAISPRPFNRNRFQQKESGKRLRTNERIRVSPIRLIDENDEMLGVVPTDAARLRAQEAGLDLVEVSPSATPPVCKIMDYGKWKYQQQKKEQKAKANTKKTDTKILRMRPRTDKHDRDLKAKHAREFILAGHKVQFILQYRGREMAHRELGEKALREVVETLGDVAKMETPPSMQGRRMSLTVAPDKHRIDMLRKEGKTNQNTTPAESAKNNSASENSDEEK